jgi:hypothetical protein
MTRNYPQAQRREIAAYLRDANQSKIRRNTVPRLTVYKFNAFANIKEEEWPKFKNKMTRLLLESPTSVQQDIIQRASSDTDYWQKTKTNQEVMSMRDQVSAKRTFSVHSQGPKSLQDKHSVQSVQWKIQDRDTLYSQRSTRSGSNLPPQESISTTSVTMTKQDQSV